MHVGTNNISNNANYLNNVKRIVKLVKESCKDINLSFSSVFFCTDIKDINATINTTNFSPRKLLQTAKCRMY